MSVNINGLKYLTVSEMAEELGVSRQTLWRWRQDPGVPQGYHYRRNQILFSPSELEFLKEYANRLEPVNGGSRQQLRLFGSV